MDITTRIALLALMVSAPCACRAIPADYPRSPLGWSVVPAPEVGSDDLQRANSSLCQWKVSLAGHEINPYGAEPLPEPWRSGMRESWRRIFDVEELRETNTIQACVEQMELADVFEVTRFTAAVRVKGSG